jgi:AraC-like DNA-binding protein
MGSIYREFRPSSVLAPYIECFWTGDVVQDFSARVLPDGCADILFTSHRNELVDVEVVGVMTRARVVPLAAGTSLFGVRFHAGMAGACLGCELRSLNDRLVPLRSLLGGVANDFAHCFSHNDSVATKMAAIEDRFSSLPTINRVQKAIREFVGRRGQLCLEDFAAVAGIGVRQLRRACHKQSGLAPKHLARVLRFRHVVTRLRHGEQNMAHLSLECGYCDQAHMIREFRELAGISPGRYLLQGSR